MSVAFWLVALVLAGVVAVAARTDGEVDAEDFFWPAALFLAIVISVLGMVAG